jgi:hypothetical protein
MRITDLAVPEAKAFWKQFLPASWFRTVATVDGWQFHVTMFSHIYQTIDGQTVRDQLIMRRRGLDGAWQYRAATEAEQAEWFDRLQY